jgi:hypothetical protein
MHRLLPLAALLLVSCSSAPHVPRVVGAIPCHEWYGGKEVRVLTLDALAPPEFICGERICYSDQGACFYNCPDSWMPAFCEGYR